MKNFLTILSGLFCLFLSLPVHSQLEPQRQSAPSSKETLPNSAQGISGQLFTPVHANARSVNIDPGIEHYQLLAVDEEARSQLLLEAPSSLVLHLPSATQANREMELVLQRVNPFSAGFVLRTASGQVLNEASLGLHYQGIVEGIPDARVALSILPDEMQGLIAIPGAANQVLGPLPSAAELAPDKHTMYVLYDDKPVFEQEDFDCGTADSAIPYEVEDLRLPNASARSGSCVGVYLEVDFDICTNKGGVSDAASYISAVFNEVMLLYADIQIELSISEMFIWDQPSPYAGTSSGTLLSQFQSQRPNFNGDIAQLLSYKASGGIAFLNGLCHPTSTARMSFSSIATSFQQAPTYSWTVMVVAHEIGHLLGSQHTHACVWNGNGTAIDGCSGFTEGNCPNPGVPLSGGGSIMSYCHITPVGVSFSTGFGPQPAAVMLNKIASASCVVGANCGGNPPPPPPPPPPGDGDGGNPPPPPPPPPPGNGDGDGDNPTADSSSCETNVIYLQLTLDLFGTETTWQIEDANQSVVASGGPYAKKKAGFVVRDTFCLPDGCYQIRMMDEDGDGLCCQYGQGGYKLIDSIGRILAEGAVFDSIEVKDFCLPDVEPPSTDDCLSLNFNEYSVISYGENQDDGIHTIFDNGAEIYIANNAWKAIEMPYTVTANTIVELEFRSTIEGEIHGFGFDEDMGISSEFTFRLHGTQIWGINDFANYSGNGAWQAYRIPVGDFVQGEALYFFLASDHDLGARNGNSYFRNIRIYEGEECTTILPSEALPARSSRAATKPRIFPNPAKEYIQFNSGEGGMYQIRSLTGQLLTTGDVSPQGSIRIPTKHLVSGTYLLSFQGEQQQFTERFVVL